jgi:hypothetical protein
MMPSFFRSAMLAVFAFATVAVFSGTAPAQEAPPANKPILVISGKINPTDQSNSVQFDRAALEALGVVSLETNTPWYKGPVKFEGVSLDQLMQAVGAKGDRVDVVALNDYSIEIPIEDFAKYHAILALKRDGEYMTVRDKGPLFIVYPYDQNPELKSQKFYSRSAWQVAKIIVK